MKKVKKERRSQKSGGLLIHVQMTESEAAMVAVLLGILVDRGEFDSLFCQLSDATGFDERDSAYSRARRRIPIDRIVVGERK